MKNNDGGKKHKKQKKALKKPRDFAVSFLREIPGPEGKGISLKDLTEGDEQKEAWAEQLLLFLSLFDAVDVTDKTIKSKNRTSKDFIQSLALYLDNEFTLVSNWDEHRSASHDDSTYLLEAGINLLTSMETRRTVTFKDDEILDNVKINLFLIKANVKGTREPQFLLEYNTKTHMYQFIGGYMTGASPESKESYSRLAYKDLPINNFDPEKDYHIEVLPDVITKRVVSKKWGIYTQYQVYLSFVKFTKPSLKLNGKEKWFTFDEIIEGKTSEGIKIASPFEDNPKAKSLIDVMKQLPLSLAKVQEEVLHDLANTLNPRNDSKRIKDLVKEDESISLEYKSSARWDYLKKQVNKDLEKAIVKTIAGFLNTEGGTLVIGMDDKKRVLGIENDSKTLSKNSEDGYRQYITALNTSYLGVELSNFIRISFETFNGKKLCLLDVTQSPYPVFVKEKDDREFYVRTGNSTRQLNSEEVYKYIQFNW